MTLQLEYLNQLRKNDERTTVFLVNGVKLHGQIQEIEEKDGDVHCFILDRNGHSQLIFKHAVATMLPETPPAMSNHGNKTYE